MSSGGNFLSYPAIQASEQGNVAVVFTISGPNLFGSAAHALMSEDDHSFGA